MTTEFAALVAAVCISGLSIGILVAYLAFRVSDRQRERDWIKGRHPGLDRGDADRIRAEQKRRARRRRDAARWGTR